MARRTLGHRKPDEAGARRTPNPSVAGQEQCGNAVGGTSMRCRAATAFKANFIIDRDGSPHSVTTCALMQPVHGHTRMGPLIRLTAADAPSGMSSNIIHDADGATPERLWRPL